jgi:hypothetical protein
LHRARLLEPLAMVWINQALLRGHGRNWPSQRCRDRTADTLGRALLTWRRASKEEPAAGCGGLQSARLAVPRGQSASTKRSLEARRSERL